jgi:4'-phosphopantetheinyl transferase
VLTVDEIGRASKFHTPILQSRFRRSRIALRTFLALHTDKPADKIRFKYGTFGKPEMENGLLQFSLSHSEGTALIAASTDDVGIDLEFIKKRDFDIAGLMDIVCHPAERNLLQRLAPEERHIAFYILWTRKEAYCKATGMGLRFPINTLRVDAQEPGEPVQILEKNGKKLFIEDIIDVTGFAASICLANSCTLLDFFYATPEALVK